jgi:hypothetical protein
MNLLICSLLHRKCKTQNYNSLLSPSPLPSSMPISQKTQSAMRNHVRAACRCCRKSRRRCIGGPPCDNCVRSGNESCEFVYNTTSRKPVAQGKRLEHCACRTCRMKKAVCSGGPPCENCVGDEKKTCAFGIDYHRKEHPKKRRISACLPCSLRKVRCTGTGPPCGTCTTRGVESTCEFTNSPKRNPKNTATHTTHHESDDAAESYWNADPDNEPSQEPESTLYERSDNKTSPYTFTSLDTRPAHPDNSLKCKKPLSVISSVTSLSDLTKTAGLDASDLDECAASLVGCTSYEELLDVLPRRQKIDCLIEGYFTSISMVKLAN